MLNLTFKIRVLPLFLMGLFSMSSFADSSLEFKGEPPYLQGTWGLVSGIGSLNSTLGLAIIGTVAKTILQNGFVPEINNQVFLEAEVGPLLTHRGTALIYSGHLRWDFNRNAEWSFFGLGGLGGVVSGENLGNAWQLFPRFGVGAFWKIRKELILRAELSHELIVAGVSFPL
jgi:hypothetical protein